MRKWVHRAIIIVIWLIAIVREVAHIFLWEIADLVVIIMPTCISHFMQFLYLLSVYLASSLLSKYNVVVIPSSILGPKEKAN